MSNAFTADIGQNTRELPNHNMTCCICYNVIPHKGTWTQGDNAEPLVVINKSHPSIVAHDRCCAKCNGLVVQVRTLQAFGHNSVSDLIAGMFHVSRTSVDVRLAHMRVVEAFNILTGEEE